MLLVVGVEHRETPIANHRAERDEKEKHGILLNALWKEIKGKYAKPADELNDDEHADDAPSARPYLAKGKRLLAHCVELRVI